MTQIEPSGRAPLAALLDSGRATPADMDITEIAAPLPLEEGERSVSEELERQRESER